MFTYDISKVPFSCAGSWLKIVPTNSGRLQICQVRRLPNERQGENRYCHDIYEIALYQGEQELKYEWAATPWRLDLTAENGGQAAIVFGDDKTLVFQLSGVTLKLLPFLPAATLTFRTPHHLIISSASGSCYHQFLAGRGVKLQAIPAAGMLPGETWHGTTAPMIVISGTNKFTFLFRVDLYGELLEEAIPFNTAVQALRHEWEDWLSRMPEVANKYLATARLAWLVLWNCTVNPEGPVTRRVMLMSKNWMNMVWSWDNCFDAIAVVKADPEFAFNQLRIMFDNQAPTGALPDSVNSLYSYYNFVKPPIYGWTVMQMVNRVGMAIARDFLREAYEPMCRQTEWWYRYRDSDHDGMCEYSHGNDSGWDNATAFDLGYPTESADLGAHLVLQTEGLALMAEALGKTAEARHWQERSKQQLSDLLQQGVKSSHFFSPLSGKRSAPPTMSLLNYQPMMLGRRLPAPLFRALAKDLAPDGPFLTNYSLATESPRSPKYIADGYWRGPIWAPSTYLIFDGLVDAGNITLAQTIARRFCDMCVKDPYMWENFDALTGKGLRCPSYSWTAAVFLLMAAWVNENNSNN